MTAVAKLPEKWREHAAQIGAHTTAPHGLTWDHGACDALNRCADELTAALSPAELGGVEKRAPVQGYHARNIPWEVHGLAWEAYAKKCGRGQSAEQLANRGGFGIREMDEYLPDWRKRVAEIDNPTPRAAEAEWLPIESAPVATDALLTDVETCLVYGQKIGRQLGRAWRYVDGSAQAQAYGFHGFNDDITHWRPLPAPPSLTQPEGGDQVTEITHIEVLRKVIHWAESRCPCKEETPDPCTLCGATVAEGTCKAVESIFPRDLLRDLRDALSARASAGEGGEWVMVPRRLTAENGAKGLLSGEFCEHFEFKCYECDDGMIDDEPCDDCDGRGTHRVKVPIEWTTIKAIHRMVVEHLAAAPQPQLDECPACKLGQATCGYHARIPATPPAHGDGEGVPFDVVREVVKARTRLGFASPEGQEEQAARAVELIRELCEEVIALTTRPTLEARDAVDARRYRYLRDHCKREWYSDMPHNKGAPSLDIEFEARGHDLDAAIDAALALPAQGEGK